MNCYIISNLIIFIVAVICNDTAINTAKDIYVYCIIISLYIIIKHAPIEAIAKPLDKIEQIHFRKKAIINVIVETAIIIGLYRFGFVQYGFVLVIAMALSAMLVIIQKMYAKFIVP